MLARCSSRLPPSRPQFKVSRREACLGSSCDGAILGNVAQMLAVVTAGPVTERAFAGKVVSLSTSANIKYQYHGHIKSTNK